MKTTRNNIKCYGQILCKGQPYQEVLTKGFHLIIAKISIVICNIHTIHVLSKWVNDKGNITMYYDEQFLLHWFCIIASDLCSLIHRKHVVC